MTADAVTTSPPLTLDRPHDATPAELVDLMREAVRRWAAIHAHYFGPDVIDRAAELLAGNAVPAAGLGRTTLPASTVMAFLHCAASH